MKYALVFERWSARFDDGPCEKRKCSAEIALGDFANAHLVFLAYHQRLLRLYEVLGGRPVLVDARVSVRDGLVQGKSYSLFTDVSACEAGDCGSFGYTLIGENSTSDSILIDKMSTHSTYRIGWPSGCEICVKIYARFTSQTSQSDVERVGGLNLSCVTRWVTPCKTKEDIMPGAWQQAEKDRQLRSEKRRSSIRCVRDEAPMGRHCCGR
jgi:hypothetical protein